MAESKKYWYIQLNVNFFEDERIDWLCEQTNGYAYVVLYLKLCLKTANNNGILTRQIGDMIIPYNIEKIAEITHMNVDVVRVALELYKRIGLVYEADENHNFMRLPEVPNMVGCITQAAIDKRRQRSKKALPIPDNVQDNVRDNVPQELRDKSKELRDKSKEQETEKDKDSASVASVLLLYRDKINAEAATATLDKLRAYCDAMGAECCMRAIQIALDEKKPLWSYIQGILRNKFAAGVRCIEDWDRLDREWEERKDRETQKSSQKVAWNDPDYYKHDEGDGF